MAMKPNEVASAHEQDRAFPGKGHYVVWNQTRLEKYPYRIGRKAAINAFVQSRPPSENVPTIHRVIKGACRPSELAMEIAALREPERLSSKAGAT